MNCEAFERWLDDGMPEAEAGPARTHAASCARCAAALAAAEAIEVGLAHARFEAPAGLTDHVMARIAAVEAHRAQVAATPVRWRDAFPWWARAAADPAVVAAAALCALLIWQWSPIVHGGISLVQWMRGAESNLALPAAGFGMQVALAVLVTPASLWLAWAAFRASERWAVRSTGRVSARGH